MAPTHSHFSVLYDSALALIYPQACHVCLDSVESRHDGVVCDACWRQTRIFGQDEVICWKCGALTSASVDYEKRKRVRCTRCDDDAFTNARACGLYQKALRASILNLKRERRLPTRLQELMLSAQQREPLNTADLIIPVPLHPERERQRGFNQAAILARALSELSRLPLDENSVGRTIHTERHRAGMDSKARRKSVANAFAVRDAAQLASRRILLIDDVFTTGATVSTCAAAIREAGAQEVLVLTVARA